MAVCDKYIKMQSAMQSAISNCILNSRKTTTRYYSVYIKPVFYLINV